MIINLFSNVVNKSAADIQYNILLFFVGAAAVTQ